MSNSAEECISQVEENNERFKNFLIAQNLKLREERDQALDECQKTLKELESLKTVSGDSLRPEQEQMFTSMVNLKLCRSQNGLIKAQCPWKAHQPNYGSVCRGLKCRRQ